MWTLIKDCQTHFNLKLPHELLTISCDNFFCNEQCAAIKMTQYAKKCDYAILPVYFCLRILHNSAFFV